MLKIQKEQTSIHFFSYSRLTPVSFPAMRGGVNGFEKRGNCLYAAHWEDMRC